MNVAFIPVRGGSKSIPLKNIKPIAGQPLVYWTVKAACECQQIDKVYVATDSPEIKQNVEGFKSKNGNIHFEKVVVIGRSKESASDTASTESAMLEFARKYEFDNIVLIQATSPLLTCKDLENGFTMFGKEHTDSVLSVVRQKRFNWTMDEDGVARPTNYDVFHRPRRQEFDGYLVENGAFYITSKSALLASNNRLSGTIRAVEMREESFFEIDEPSDWTIVESLMQKEGFWGNEKKRDFSRKRIRLLLTDCDGCLTDGGMYYSENGDEMKKFNTRDGVGFELLKKKGILTGIITGENRKLNRRRAEKLKLDILEQGCKEKIDTIKRICEDLNIVISEVAYIGDDINDLDVVKAVGFSACPQDACKEIKDAVNYIAVHNGGTGVIREIAELLIED